MVHQPGIVTRVIVLTLIIFAPLLSSAQLLASAEKSAAKSLELKRWDKAFASIQKVLVKDTFHVVGRYLLASYYFQPDNPQQQLDSAYNNIIRGIDSYQLLSPRDKEKLLKFPLDSSLLVGFRNRIDSAIFKQVRSVNTEEAYITFLENHPYAIERQTATELRDEVAFLTAKRENTHQAFALFLKKYPDAYRAPEARQLYNRLLFESSTADKKLASYERFIKDYPDTPFRAEIERIIFELYTMSGEVDKFISFSQRYPSSRLSRKALHFVFHLIDDQQAQTLPLFATDSIHHLQSLQKSFLVPYMKEKRFGFMDKDGKEVMPATFDELPDEYQCGNLTEDLITLPDKIVARNGAPVYKGKIEEVDDLGSGFLAIREGSCTKLVHKAGYTLDSCSLKAKILGNRLIGLKRPNGWEIRSLIGRFISLEAVDDIQVYGNVIALKSPKNWKLFLIDEWITQLESNTKAVTEVVDQFKFVAHNSIWLKKGSQEAIYNLNLRPVISFSNAAITPVYFGFLMEQDKRVYFVATDGRKSMPFQQVQMLEPRPLAKSDGKWARFNVDSFLREAEQFDSLRYEGPFVIGVKRDSMSVAFRSGFVHWPKPEQIKFIPARDSTSYLTVTRDGKQTIFNLDGVAMFSGVYDQVSYAGEGLFMVTRKEKKGIVDSQGKQVLAVEYDALGSVQNSMVTLLKAMKFGAYNIANKKLIKPQFDKNVLVYNRNQIAVYTQGGYYFVNWDNKPLSKEMFEEVQYWNDTLALVRRNGNQGLYHMLEKRMALEGITALRWIRDAGDEKLAVVGQDDKFGVVSNRRGIVIPINFSDLVNVGSSEEPVYFTEKHVPEASIFVVIYYDRSGRFLRRDIFDNAEDYERIYCQDN